MGCIPHESGFDMSGFTPWAVAAFGGMIISAPMACRPNCNHQEIMNTKSHSTLEETKGATSEDARALSEKLDARIEQTVDLAEHAADATMDVVHRALDSTKGACHGVVEKTTDAMAKSRACLGRHPAAVVLAGLVVGYALDRLSRRSGTLARIGAIATIISPAMIVFGLCKLEALRCRRESCEQAAENLP